MEEELANKIEEIKKTDKTKKDTKTPSQILVRRTNHAIQKIITKSSTLKEINIMCFAAALFIQKKVTGK